MNNLNGSQAGQNSLGHVIIQAAVLLLVPPLSLSISLSLSIHLCQSPRVYKSNTLTYCCFFADHFCCRCRQRCCRCSARFWAAFGSSTCLTYLFIFSSIFTFFVLIVAYVIPHCIAVFSRTQLSSGTL